MLHYFDYLVRASTDDHHELRKPAGCGFDMADGVCTVCGKLRVRHDI
jgi:hypothetical protein